MVESVRCGRLGCTQPAVSVLLIAPQEQHAWVVGPDHPAALDGVPLCIAHADRISVPFGWALTDERPPARPVRRPSRPRKRAAPEPTPVVVLDDDTITDPAPPEVAEAAAVAPWSKPADIDIEPADIEPADIEPADIDIAIEVDIEVIGIEVTAIDADVEVTAIDADVEVTAAEVTAAEITDAAGRRRNHPSSPAETPLNADGVAEAIGDAGARLTVVPGDDDYDKTFTVESGGQTALWADPPPVEHEPDDSTPLLKRAFRVVRDD